LEGIAHELILKETLDRSQIEQLLVSVSAIRSPASA